MSEPRTRRVIAPELAAITMRALEREPRDRGVSSATTVALLVLPESSALYGNRTRFAC